MRSAVRAATARFGSDVLTSALIKYSRETRGLFIGKTLASFLYSNRPDTGLSKDNKERATNQTACT